jgi:hypothetical protein
MSLSLVLLPIVILVAVAEMWLLKQLREVDALLRTVRLGDIVGDAIGKPAPQFETRRATTGRILTLDHVRECGGVLLFMSTHCKTCRELAKGFEQARSIPENLIILWHGAPMADVSSALDAATHNVPRIMTAFRVAGVPTAVAVSAGGVIAGYSHPTNCTEVTSLCERYTQTVDSSCSRTGGTPR